MESNPFIRVFIPQLRELRYKKSIENGKISNLFIQTIPYRAGIWTPHPKPAMSVQDPRCGHAPG